jgi:pantothenate kinase
MATVQLGFDDLLDRARRLAVPGRRHLLGITGAPGAGKSWLAEKLVHDLGADRAAVVSMDGFHLANRVLTGLGIRDRKGAIDTFDAAGYAELLERLHSQRGSGYVVYAPEFRREVDEAIGSALAVEESVPLVITEGNYLLSEGRPWRRVRACLDEVWYLAPPEEVRRERLACRHQQFGMTAAQAQAWAAGTDERNAELIVRTAQRADLVVNVLEP